MREDAIYEHWTRDRLVGRHVSGANIVAQGMAIHLPASVAFNIEAAAIFLDGAGASAGGGARRDRRRLKELLVVRDSKDLIVERRHETGWAWRQEVMNVRRCDRRT